MDLVYAVYLITCNAIYQIGGIAVMLKYFNFKAPMSSDTKCDSAEFVSLLYLTFQANVRSK